MVRELSFNKLAPQAILENKLEGILYCQNPENSIYKSSWIQNCARNFIVIEEIETLAQDLEPKSISLVLLKGYALIDDIYPNRGERFCSDVDLLIDPQHSELIEKHLLDRGYAKQKEKKWLGNFFKSVFEKKIHSLSVTIELHTQLFWHENVSVGLTKVDLIKHKKIKNCFCLSLEEQLIHLCGHYAFQHNFLKLFWLVDIQRFVEKYEEEINWDIFWQKALSFKLLISCYLSLSLITTPKNKVLKKGLVLMSLRQKIRTCFLSSILNESFLVSPRSYFLSYHTLKFLIKDQVRYSFKYMYFWFYSKMAQNS